MKVKSSSSWRTTLIGLVVLIIALVSFVAMLLNKISVQEMNSIWAAELVLGFGISSFFTKDAKASHSFLNNRNSGIGSQEPDTDDTGSDA